MAFDHLRESAARCFDDSQSLRASKPEAAMAAQSHGHEILASYLLANGDPGYRTEIEALLHSEIARFGAFGTSVRTLPQHSYLLLALALGDVKTAIAIASLPIDRKNWATFDSAFVHRICSILHVPQDAKPPRARPTTTERIFLNALDLVAEGKPYRRYLSPLYK